MQNVNSCLGYDTLHISKLLTPSEQRDTSDFIKTLDTYRYTGRGNGHLTHYANLNNLTVKITDKITVHGSIPKFINGQNVDNLTDLGLKNGIEILSDTFGVNLTDSKVTRLDFGTTLRMESDPCLYFPYLGEGMKFRNQNDSTLTYKNHSDRSSLQFQFYDKGKEIKGSKQAQIFGDNLLRAEFRCMDLRGIKSLNHPSVLTVNTLCDKDFYHKLTVHFVNEFEKIQKISSANFKDIQKMEQKIYESPSKFKDELLSMLIKVVGKENLPNIEKIQFSKNQQKYLSRLKNEINELLQKENFNEQNDELLTELETKIRALKNVA